MKVFTIPVSDKTIQDKSLLYPGCFVDVFTIYELNRNRVPKAIPGFIVDVLVKFKLIRKKQGSISTFNLYQIQVLSVKCGVRGTFVNLIVDPEEAEILSLAKKNGRISLTIPKPFDEWERMKLDIIPPEPITGNQRNSQPNNPEYLF